MHAISLRAAKIQWDPSTALATLGSLVMVTYAHVSILCVQEQNLMLSARFHQGEGEAYLSHSPTHTPKYYY